MPTLGPELAPAITAHSAAGVGEMAQALTRTFDRPVSLTIGEPQPFDPANSPPEFVGPGLGLALTIGDTGAAVVFAETPGILPAWYANPDPTGQSKLTTLAQELGMLLLPDDFMPDGFEAARVSDLKLALQSAGLSAGCSLLPLKLAADQTASTAWLIWPLPQVKNLLAPPPDQPQSPPQQSPAPSSPQPSQQSKPVVPPKPQPPATSQAPAPRPPSAPSPHRSRRSLDQLPPYARSLLKIRVPVAVTLAAKKQPVGHILELGPGSIIQFDKSCEEMLDLNVGNQLVARGEAVKVGEKFGLRVTSVILPDERFHPVRPTPQPQPARS